MKIGRGDTAPKYGGRGEIGRHAGLWLQYRNWCESSNLFGYPKIFQGVYMRKSLLNSYSDDEFRAIVATSHTHAECLRNLGYNTNSGNVQRAYRERLARLNIDTSHITTKARPVLQPEDVFVQNCTHTNSTLRRFYSREVPPTECSICKRLPEWEDKPLALILDHINGIHSDSRRENLRWVCPNCNSQLETTNGKNRNRRTKTIKQCIDCGTKIDKSSTRCNKCEQQRRKLIVIQQRHERISRDELKQAIRNTAFTTIGRQFNVDGNTIKQWCKAYGLPSRKSDIKQCSNEEWEQI